MIHPDWKGLPVQVLRRVFSLAIEKDLCHLTMVCKAWSQPAQAMLYSNVVISNWTQFEMFFETVTGNTQLGNMVKKFGLSRSLLFYHEEDTKIQVRMTILHLVTLLLGGYLPKLEKIEDNALCSYDPVINALLTSSLEHLKWLYIPTNNMKKDEISNYVTCVLIMKNQLENIYLSDSYGLVKLTGEEKQHFERLYNELHEFDRLTEIKVQRKTNDVIRVLEHIIENTKSLQDIVFDFAPHDDDSPINKDVSMAAISDFIPRTNVKTLQSRTIHDEKTLLYIIHKFPQLSRLLLATSKSFKLSQHVLSKLLYYLHEINTFAVSELVVDDDVIARALGDFWVATSRVGNERIEFRYSEVDSKVSLGLFKRSVNITYPLSRSDWLHTAFMERNGKFLSGMLLSMNDADNKPALPNNFVIHTLDHCPNLEYLILESCTLRQSSDQRVDSSKQHTLKGLSFENCAIEKGVMEQISLLLSRLKQLSFQEVKYLVEEEGSPMLEIAMPHTEIGTIVFDYSKGEPIYVQLFVVSEKKYYYYKYDSSEIGYSKEVKEEEYPGVGAHTIDVVCQSKAVIRFEFIQQ